jgi:hypothetical protein
MITRDIEATKAAVDVNIHKGFCGLYYFLIHNVFMYEVIF